MDNDEILTQMDASIRHLENAAELLSKIDGLEHYAEDLFEVMANLEMEMEELESVED